MQSPRTDVLRVGSCLLGVQSSSPGWERKAGLDPAQWQHSDLRKIVGTPKGPCHFPEGESFQAQHFPPSPLQSGLHHGLSRSSEPKDSILCEGSLVPITAPKR